VKERLAQGVERARADVAVHDPERGQRQARQAAAAGRRLPPSARSSTVVTVAALAALAALVALVALVGFRHPVIIGARCGLNVRADAPPAQSDCGQ